MQLSWAPHQTRRSHEYFVGQIDALTDADVMWTPYTTNTIAEHAPDGLSSLSFRDQHYWRTTTPLVYDIHIEEYHVCRVMRQFGLYQTSPLPVAHSVTPSVHR
jgi:hypothetical protein